MSASLARAVSVKRLLVSLASACLVATVVVAAAPAGSISDVDPCPRGSGVELVCPPGTEGSPYSVKFHGDEQPICRPGDDQWFATNGTVPPGLSLALDGTLSGTPTRAGSYSFWIELKLPDHETCSSRDNSEERVTITINPGVARLVIGPESAPVGTVNAAYSLRMTASLPDPKTWSIVGGALPPGLALGATDGLISGTPTAEGSYGFTVRAVLADQRSDTKALGIVVRNAVAVAAPEVAGSEVGVPFLLPLAATGGTGTFTWSLTTGALPPGLTLGPTGTIAGTPTRAGSFAFTATATDPESRTGSYRGTLEVALRLAVVNKSLRPATVGRYLEVQLRSRGGVEPTTWRIKRGPLPRGVLFDRELGLFYGTPTRARTYGILVEARDGLRVRATATVTLVVKKARTLKR
jgi:Putative Ig domain